LKDQAHCHEINNGQSNSNFVSPNSANKYKMTNFIYKKNFTKANNKKKQISDFYPSLFDSKQLINKFLSTFRIEYNCSISRVNKIRI